MTKRCQTNKDNITVQMVQCRITVVLHEEASKEEWVNSENYRGVAMLA